MRDAQHVPGGGPEGKAPLRRWVTCAVAAVSLSTLSLAVIPVTATAAGGAGGAGATYVSLGDSYVSGPLIPNQSLDPLGCLRSSADYPADTAAALGLSLTDISCSGATTSNMNNPQNVTPGPPNPPQLSVVTSGTQVVSLSIGGNDIGFVSILENCLAYTPAGPTPVGQTCQSYYDPNGDDKLGASIEALEPVIAGIIQQIHTQAPSAKVFVVGYPDILPKKGACWPSMPIQTSDALYLNSKEIQLDGVLKTAATENKAIFVNTYNASEGHNACEPESKRWIEPVIPASSAAPVHPNAAGMAGEAKLLEAAMKRAGIS
jgi:hypothetical protein